MIDIIAALLLVLGGFFSLFAGIGIVRMPDVYIRMHASTKVGTLASGLIMAGVAVHFSEPSVVIKSVLVILFLLLTAPIAAHMIGRAALHTGVKPWGVGERSTK
ncbi:MAG: monovalent cation/H(+) antiporter subunit G [Aestuariivita sp.]|nr:monovalent cation/H(+) antiporter subunit G [Aestuariivita sp.]MCY4203888.1 monovalent cation/H(+) antiporter subunit G [Aestuariivita sp.]MCY4287868.1 monovalent cation/H(+) antiporter subunit G [Aestuariivita sp.]MCY4345321.1 monovalent cation/H(+) antiporter subunit G [Aestuariivita sp.]